MLHIRENIPLRPKTTLRIGGNARWYAELKTKEDVEEASAFANRKNIPLIVLGSGSNTVFADGTINALIAQIRATDLPEEIDALIEAIQRPDPHRHIWTSNIGPADVGGKYKVIAKAGKNLAELINDLADQNLDLSPLTGIPGTIGGAIYGNSGQGFDGIWINSYVYSVDAFVDGEWKLFANEDCDFGYRTSIFKNLNTPIIWEVMMHVPSRPRDEIKSDIECLLQRRIETQPHAKTAGSCFLSINKDTPAWKLIDSAGLRGHRIGDIAISEKHANFLVNEGEATFEDAKALVTHIQSNVPVPLTVEMRFVEKNGHCLFG